MKMNTQITTRNTEIENIHSAAQEDAGFEKMIKFRKGQFFIGEEEIPLGTEYLAHAAAWVKCWIKFIDGEPVDRKPYRVALGEKPPLREDLGCRDENEWPEDEDGHPTDPWVLQYLLPLENLKNGEVVIFVTSSHGGKQAVADLCNTFAKRTKKTGCGQPIIKLAKTTFPSNKYGPVLRPLFEVDGWDRDEPSNSVVGLTPNDTIPPATSEADFQDEIDF
jgi:hypothetical protein